MPKAKTKVLIVEDVDSMRALLEHLVSGIEDLVVSGTCKNGIETRLEISRRRPDLVLLDEILPGESLEDTLSELARHKIPVVLMTGFLEPEPRIPRAHALGRMAKPTWETLETDRKRYQKAIREALDKAAHGS